MMTADLIPEVPYSHPAEQGVIGSLLLPGNGWEEIDGRLSATDFFSRHHQLIFQAVADLAKAGKAMDVIAVATLLESRRMADEVGGLAYLATLAKETPSAGNIRHYAAVVREKSIQRALIAAAGDIAALAHFPGPRTVGDLVEEAERQIFAIGERARGHGQVGDWQSYREIVARSVEQIEVAFTAKTHITGTATGFADLDDATTGLHPGELWIVAGRPAMGKTTLAVQVAEHVGINLDKPVAIFSMEMPAVQLANRSIASHSRVNLRAIRTGQLGSDDWPRITGAINRLADANMHVDDSPGLSPSEVRARLRRLVKTRGPLGLVVIDYLQLMRVPGMEKNRVQEVSEVSRQLKAIAKEFAVPVIALSQLNRELEKRVNKRPIMSDLRESGAIEQDADGILFVYRDEVYNPDSPEKGKAEVIIGKQRNGSLSTVNLAFMGEYTRFENLAKEYQGGGYGEW